MADPQTPPRPRSGRPTGLPAAIGLLLVAAGVAGELRFLWTVAPYVAVAQLALGIACLACAVGVLVGDNLASRVFGLTAVVFCLGGHVLAKTVGLPGATALNGPPGPGEVTMIALQLLTGLALSLQLVPEGPESHAPAVREPSTPED